ncbi:condensation domain-containing protein [Dactylosporangium sp. NPDC048998]|uniref:condensation domain-containing protein n=1 Tax=Dactylosporangium sp. NPDC048998 TaxID=3363976 RepID=UPI0037193FBB
MAAGPPGTSTNSSGTVLDAWRLAGRADRTRPLPLSAGQQQMWLLHQLDPASPAYLMSWVLRISGPLHADGLQRAWERVVDRHEILRTRYATAGGEPVQLIDPPGRFAMRVVDATGDDPDARMQRARRIAEWLRRKPFDLTADHPVRVTLIAVEPEVHLLVVAVHHIACDETAFQRISAEVSACYAEQVSGPPAQLPEPEVQYADFAAWELANRQNGSLRRHVEYWRRALAGVTDLPLPLDRPRPARSDRRAGTVDFAITPATADGIRAVASAYRASVFIVLLAAYHAMLSHISGSADVTVGTPVSARTVPGLDEVVGYLVNTVVVRSRHTEEETFEDVLSQVRRAFLEAMDHRSAPFKWVVDEVNPARATGANPLFQASFDMSGAGADTLALRGLQVEQLGLSDTATAKFDLILHVAEAPDGRLFGRVEFDTAVIDEATARRWAAYGEALLETVVRDPRRPLAAIRAGAAGPGSGERAAAILPAITSAPSTMDSAAPDGAQLEAIHRAWREVLGRADVDVRDNFFDVGGDSLRAVALAARLKAEGLPVTATDVFAHQTVERLAEACAAAAARQSPPDESSGTAAVAPFALLSQRDRDALPPDVVDAYPLAAMQLGMLIELFARPDLNTYQDSTSYLVRGAGRLDAAVLQRAAQLVVDRHEVLRTSFEMKAYSVPLQLVHRQATITVGVANHGVLGSEDGWLPLLEEYAAGQRRSLIDVRTAPLIRVFAHTADDRPEWWITITECHPILEGWSFHTMLMEILTAYQQIREGRDPAEPERAAFRYADYIAAEAAARQSEEDRAYWRSVVAGRTDALLPLAWRDDLATPRERYQHLVDVRDMDADLRRLATETGTSLKAVLLAAHLTVMSMAVGSKTFFTGLVCDARPEVVGADRVLGMYLNTLPFAMPTGTPTWRSLIRAVYDALTDLWPHRVYPLQLIQQEFGHDGRLLEVFFNYLDFHQVDSELIDEERTLNDNDNEFALHVFTLPGAIKLNTTNHCLNREAAVRLAGLYRTVLGEMTLDPDGDAEPACPAPPQRAGTPHLPPGGAESLVPAAFARAVGEHPDDVAVRQLGQSITYRELDAWADAIALRLRQLGIAPGSVVAVAAEQDLGTPAAILGAWKAHMAWTPVAARPEEPGWRPAVSALITADDPGGSRGDVPVLATRDLRPSGAIAEPAWWPGPRPEDVACVLPVDTSAGSDHAAFTHDALARSLAGANRRLRALDPQPSRRPAWVCAGPLTSCGAISDLLAPLMCAGTAVLTAGALPDAIPEILELVERGAVTHIRATSLVLERVLRGRPATGLTAVVCEDRPRTGPAPAGSDGIGRLIPAIAVDAFPGWIALDGWAPEGLGARVLGAELQAVPAGVVGELCLYGPGLGRYDTGSPGLYRTGRLVRCDDAGALEPLGSIRQRTQREGRPIELFRTRELLDLEPSVTDSLVALVADPGLGVERLVGFVRTDRGTPVDEERVRHFLADRRLPRRLVPDELIAVTEWPLDGRGTVDEDRLAELWHPADAPAVADKPWDEAFETLLRNALDPVSFAGELDPDMPLDDVGLDSFGKVGLLVAIEEAYALTVPDEAQIAEMFRTPRTLWDCVVAFGAAQREQRVAGT